MRSEGTLAGPRPAASRASLLAVRGGVAVTREPVAPGSEGRTRLVAPGRGDDLKKQREDYVRENYLDHFDFSTLDDVGVSVTGSASRREFLHFAPDFVYRRKQLADPTVGQLEELAFRTTRRLLARSK
jgi:hypothetical protein